jgi:hypothetical protein
MRWRDMFRVRRARRIGGFGSTRPGFRGKVRPVVKI